jgi:Fur family transcriptional regulator, ferric uptake regulator
MRMISVYADLKRAGIRPTAARVAVLSLFHAHPDDHMSADGVYRKLMTEDACSLPSVYRALAQLTEAGLILSTAIAEARVVYELNNKGAHHHVVCRVCGTIKNIIEPEISERCKAVAEERKFAFRSANLIVFGTCSACSKSAKAN